MDDQAENEAVPYPDILGKMPTGYAFHRIVLDETGRPVDFVFLDVNAAFEELTGFRRQDVIGKSARDILPDQAEAGREWIEACGHSSGSWGVSLTVIRGRSTLMPNSPSQTARPKRLLASANSSLARCVPSTKVWQLSPPGVGPLNIPERAARIRA